MIKLKKLELAGFRRFTSTTTIEFPDTGLLLLDGDSGVGKSTILQAIAYALDVCPYPATSLKSWTGESLQVNLTLDIEGKLIRVCRGKRNALEIEGEEARTGAKALEEGLLKLFGMAPELLGALTYRPQDTLGLFLSKDDTEKKEFLGQILGLNSVEKAIESADATRKKLSADFSFVQGVLTEREAGLAKVLERDTEISPNPVDVGYQARYVAAQEVVKVVETELEAIQSELDAAFARFQKNSENQKTAKSEKLLQAKQLFSDLKAKNDTVKFELETKRENLRGQIVRSNQELAQINQYKIEVVKLEKELGALRANTCYVCHQPFTAELAIDEKQEKLETLHQRISSEPVLLTRVKELSQKLHELVPFEDEREGKLLKVIGELNQEVNSIGKNITDTRVIKLQEAKDNKFKSLLKAKNDKASAEQDFANYQNIIRQKEKFRDRFEADKATAQTLVEDKKIELQAIETALNAEKDFIQILGKDGFLGVIFDEVLDEISKETNQILGKLSNTSHVSVEFRSETTKGKKSIVPVFRVGEFETTRSSGLSGGMGTSADLAVDLGVVSVVERRLGSAPGWLLLDETFNGMPRATKESALEILQQYSKDRLVVVVDHGTELKESFGTVLTVFEENGRSSIR